ncbi:PTR2 family proton/oligopeptide symporter, conserved site [Sesbania bispinosa]|nr:PTR2 family proton/oligopeptide symporter, conserved site [Sesbania bispinosa]
MEKKMSWTVADAVDYKGFPADRSKTGGWVPAALILGIEIVERLSTMGIAVNLVTYMMGVMHLPSSTAANTVTDFMGTSFLLCLLGGFLADSFLGRYKTIGIFASIQTLGTASLAISTTLPQLRPPPCHSGENCKPANGFQMGILYLALYLIALGTGGLKSSVSGFGSDQFDEKDEKEKSQMTYFFNRFFFFISFGTLAAVTVLVYIQDEVSRSWAYGICSVSMVIAILIFLSGTKRYRYKKSLGSPIVHIFQVIVAASKKRKMELPYNVGSLYEDTPEASRIEHTEQFRLIMPLWKKWNGKPGFTSLQRIGIGLMLSILGMAAACVCEMKRLSVAKGEGRSNQATLPISVFLLIPQFFLVGAGEAFIYTGQLDFFITQSPKGMKTMSTGLFLTTLSLGFFVSSFLVSVIKKVTGTRDGQGWLADNINKGRLDLFYALLTILSFINFVAFVVCALWYKPKKPKPSMQMGAINGSSAEEKC